MHAATPGTTTTTPKNECAVSTGDRPTTTSSKHTNECREGRVNNS